MNYSFVVPGEPHGKARPRVVRRGDRTYSYTPEKTREYEQSVRAACADAAPGMIHGAVSVRIVAHYPVQDSWSQEKKDLALAQMILPVVKPDADNVIKVILDGMNGVAWDDDKQVTHTEFDKVYSAIPRVVVEVWEVKEFWKFPAWWSKRRRSRNDAIR